MLTAILTLAAFSALANVAGVALLVILLRKLDQARVAFTQQVDDLRQAALDLARALAR